MQLKLSEEDQERLGLEGWFEYDQDHLSESDAEMLEGADGDWTAWGTTKVMGLRCAIWLALHKAGKAPATVQALTFDVRQVRVPLRSPGKAPSVSADTSTPSKSATSHAGTSRRKK